MSCPFNQANETGPEEGNGSGDQELSYHSYLQLDKILKAQQMKSQLAGQTIHDEHLFIIVHQVYELWFKQILYDIDCIREIFKHEVDDGKMLDVVKRIQRVILILKMCNDQMYILETMTPFDFLQFRGYLFPASGFQSWQFRILENALGVQQEQRIKYNKGSYKQAFEKQPKNTGEIEASEVEVSLLQLLDGWLQKTLEAQKPKFDFCKKYREAVEGILQRQEQELEAESDESLRANMKEQLAKRKAMFDSLLDKAKHDDLLKTGDRRFSHLALSGALMIFLYREHPAFTLAHQFLHHLMDVDSLIAKWRYSHMMLVQRMLGSKMTGTAGSTGYSYLKLTVSGEQYKVFLDLFNLSAFLLPQESIPK